MKDNIFVTQPTMPPLEEFIPYLEQIWENKILTNSGPFHEQLEEALAEYLGVPYVSLFSSGTSALVAAIKALGMKRKVITTPYTFVATTHALMWNDIEPVFADIDQATLNLSPEKVVEAIDHRVTGVLPVHCYGTPCDVDAFKSISREHNISLLYDAAHAFGIKYNQQSLLNYGDLSILSFHATKVFTTFEGGAIICGDISTKRRIDQLKNFGFTGETSVNSVGINGKMSEVHAAFGLLQLQHFEENRKARQYIYTRYNQIVDEIQGLERVALEIENNCFSYYPIFVKPEYGMSRDELYERLKKIGVNSRRYFYPLVSNFPNYTHIQSADPKNLPNAYAAAKEVLCLPIYPQLPHDTIDRIGMFLRETIINGHSRYKAG